MRQRTTRLFVALAFCLVLVGIAFAGAPGRAQTISVHLTLGNPSAAVSDPAVFDNFLIVRDQYAVAYHRDRGIPTWVSWRLASEDLGDTPRYSGQFITDTSLPDGWYRVRHADYTNSGYDRGHMTPSADRTTSEADNRATFILTNVLPQAPANNQGPWAQLEALARDLARIDNELYIISGGHGALGALADGRLTIPAVTWKAILILPAAEGDDVARVGTETQVIAIWMPNDASVAGASWEEYQVSVACIEQRTGLNLFSAVDPAIQAALEGAPCDPVVDPSAEPTLTPMTPTPVGAPTVTPTEPPLTPTAPTPVGAPEIELFLPLLRANELTLPTEEPVLTPVV
jgi:endonuclease G, mitochondrial